MRTTSRSMLARIRRHAPLLCERSGRPMPARLLIEGLPSADSTAEPWPEPASIDDLVAWFLRDHPGRRRHGVYFTPRPIARALLDDLAEDGFSPGTILDPSVGAGAFLLAARERFGPTPRLYGVDRDPAAVALARLALWIAGAVPDPDDLAASVRLGDALALDWRRVAPEGGFDLVCGNPPFGNAIERRTGRDRAENDRMKRRFPGIARGPYDRSVPFVRLSGELLATGGRYALLLPRALLAARYAEPLRAWLHEQAPLNRLVRFPDDRPLRECSIAMIGWIGGRASPPHGGPQSAETWGGLIFENAEPLARSAVGHPALGEICEVRAAASVAEAYRLAQEIRDGGGDGWRFLTAGTIERYGDLWSSAVTRCLGRRFSRPVLPRDAPGLSPQRARLYERPKIVVAGLARRFKACWDPDGDVAGGAGLLIVAARDGDPTQIVMRRVALLLNSDWWSDIHRLRRGPLALSGGSIPVSRRDLEEMPLPDVFLREVSAPDRGDWAEFLSARSPELPRDNDLSLCLLDAAAEILLRGSGAGSSQGVASWDRLAQRIIFHLVSLAA